ncbi:unnamed protein product [Closterium sp. Naga37s-1]|nr:unnamed protein product [Closterium sp. Naga37s-1]
MVAYEFCLIALKFLTLRVSFSTFCPPWDAIPSLPWDDIPSLPWDAIPSLPCDAIPSLPWDAIPSLPWDAIPSLPWNAIPSPPWDAIPSLPWDAIPSLPWDAIPSLPWNAIPSLPWDAIPSLSRDATPSLPWDAIPSLPQDAIPSLPGDAIPSLPWDAIPSLPWDAIPSPPWDAIPSLPWDAPPCHGMPLPAMGCPSLPWDAPPCFVQQMADKNHPNIVRLLGFAVGGDMRTRPEQILIYEFVPNGDLGHYLKNGAFQLRCAHACGAHRPQPTIYRRWEEQSHPAMGGGVPLLSTARAPQMMRCHAARACMPMSTNQVKACISSDTCPFLKDLGMDAPDDVALRLAQLALRCTVQRTASRPSMADVANELQGIRHEVVGKEELSAAIKVDEQAEEMSTGTSFPSDLAEQLRLIRRDERWDIFSQ